MENLKNVAPLADFDWDAFENGTVATGENHKATEAAYEQTLNNVHENEVVEGEITDITKREVVVRIGSKSDGVIPANEFRYNPELKIGDKVEVYVENLEDKKGQLILSHKKARASKSWERINQALENKEIIKGYIKCRTKGGMIVDVFGIEAFLPGSQIDVKPIRDYDVYVGQTLDFQVVKINQEYKNVVVSHKALIEAELEAQKQQIISTLEKGQVLEGTVKNITNYGVFIDLGGVDGLVHITDLSWGRVSNPREVVQDDEKLKVVILDFDEEKKRIALGIKQLTPHPWDALDADLKVGDKVKGRVVVMADYGAFVEIAPGVEGLIHVSEMSWSQHLRSAQDFLKVGDEVEAVVLTLDRTDRKMSLGLKQLKEDPWKDIEVKVLEIDKDNRRLSLGHKQIEENPWDVFETVFTEGSVHEGTITELHDKGAVVQLQYGVEGFVTPRHLVKEDGSKAQLNEKLAFKVLEFNKDSRRILLSHTRTFDESVSAERTEKKPRRAAAPRANKEEAVVLNNQAAANLLGDNDALAALKAKIEKGE